MIPKIIHYCWFGGNPLPKAAKKCIASWKKYLPDYVIKEWNENNFDVNSIPYTADAYKAKKYAFVSDYARFWILYHYGGLYFDTDVEIIRPLDDIILEGPFLGCEKDFVAPDQFPDVAPGLGIGAEPNMLFFRNLLNIYKGEIFEKNIQGSYKTVISYTTDLLIKYGLKAQGGLQKVAGFTIYPKEYFNPLSHINQLLITPNTRTIHHYAGTWIDGWGKLKKKLVRLIGPGLYKMILKIRG